MQAAGPEIIDERPRSQYTISPQGCPPMSGYHAKRWYCAGTFRCSS